MCLISGHEHAVGGRDCVRGGRGALHYLRKYLSEGFTIRGKPFQKALLHEKSLVRRLYCLIKALSEGFTTRQVDAIVCVVDAARFKVDVY